jgi:hypothetical protein
MDRDTISNMSEDFPSLDRAAPILIRGNWPLGYDELTKVFGYDVAQSLSSSSRTLLLEASTTVSPSKRRPSYSPIAACPSIVEISSN